MTSNLSQTIAARQTERGSANAYDLITSMRDELAKALPAHVGIDHFVRLALTELRQTPRLAECSAPSLLGALMTAARLGLEPGGPLGQFYLTPRRLKGQGWSVVPIIGYQGLRDLAYRSGLVETIDAVLVREGDHYDEGANEQRGRWFEWKPGPGGSDRPVVGVIGIAKLRGAGSVFRYLDEAAINARKARGAAGDTGPWATDREAMILKTGIRALGSLLPKSTELAIANRVDEQVQTYDPTTRTGPEWVAPTDDAIANVPAVDDGATS